MIDLTSKISSNKLDFLHKIDNLLGDDKLRIVGGFIRDYFLKKDVKNVEIDLSTTLKPNEIIEKLNNNSDIVVKNIGGEKYGTVIIVDKVTGNMFEITSTRSDIETFGRDAVVKFGATFEEDSIRRDFTINAIYSDLSGKIYDYHNGMNDIESKNVRFIGKAEERICEDYLRILRYFRFSNLFNKIDDNIIYICQKYSKNLQILSKERIKNEMEKMLINKSYKTLESMKDCDILSNAIPKFCDIKIIQDIENINLEIQTKIPIQAIKFASLFYPNNYDFCLTVQQKKLLQQSLYQKQNNLDLIDTFIRYPDYFLEIYMINNKGNIPMLVYEKLKNANIKTLELDYNSLNPQEIKALVYKYKRETYDNILKIKE